MNRPIDFAILTIKEQEFTAILDQFSPYETARGGTNRTYGLAEVKTTSGQHRTILIARSLEQGQGAMQALTTNVIEDADPAWLVLAGIAGGVPDTEFTLGDVLLASRIHDFSVTAQVFDKSTTHQQMGGPVHAEVQNLLAGLLVWRRQLGKWHTASALKMKRPIEQIEDASFYGPPEFQKRARECLEKHFGKKARKFPIFRDSPVGSSNILIKDPDLVDRWRESARHLEHVEMEAGGAYRAAQEGLHGRAYPLLCIRGISDIVGYRRRPEWTTFACRSAAAFTRALLVSDAIELQNPSQRPPTKRAGGDSAAGAAAAPGASSPPPSSESDHLQRMAAMIEAGVRECLQYQNSAYRVALSRKMRGLATEVERLQRCQVRLSAPDGGRFLAEFYQNAKQHVFATRLKHFAGTFRRSFLPDDLLRAHIASKAKTTRLFIFETASDIDCFDFSEMKKQADAGIDVQVLVSPSAGRGEDFAIIDDSAVGVSEFIAPGVVDGIWNFEELPLQVKVYQEKMMQLLRKSQPLTTFLLRTPRSRLWSSQILAPVNSGNVSSYQNLSRALFGEDVASESSILEFQDQAGEGIYVLERDQKTVGILAIVPLTVLAYRLLENDNLKGSEFTVMHIARGSATPAIAHYLGAAGGVDALAKAAITDALTSIIAELAESGVESIFARPTTDDGNRVLKKLGFAGSSGATSFDLDHVCRLRLDRSDSERLRRLQR